MNLKEIDFISLVILIYQITIKLKLLHMFHNLL